MRHPHKLYLLIDEYDNFANEVLMADRSGSQDRYQIAVAGRGAVQERVQGGQGRFWWAWGWIASSSPASRRSC
jgi:hypothetical protein